MARNRYLGVARVAAKRLSPGALIDAAYAVGNRVGRRAAAVVAPAVMAGA